MKLAGAASDLFLKNPDRRIAALLIFGPDEGLVQERIRFAEMAILGPDGLEDAFRRADIDAADLKSDPARLIDEAKAIAMLGGRRVIRLLGASDLLTPVLTDFLDAIPDSENALLIVGSGELPGKSSLKSLFETRDNAAAIACYGDEGEALLSLIAAHLKSAGLRVDRDALDYLAANLGADRGITRSELDKLVLYMGSESRVTLADVQAAIGSSAAIVFDDLVFAVGAGDAAGLDIALTRNLKEMPAIAILRAIARHFLRLHQVAGKLAEGASLENALAALRPPLFWKTKAKFTSQLRAWRASEIASALETLSEIEARIMRHHDLAEAILRQGLFAIAAIRR